MENLKRDLAGLRDILDTMDWLLDEKQNRPYRVTLYIKELKTAVRNLDKHSKGIRRQYSILELNVLTPDELKEVASKCGIVTEEKGKQAIMYEILDKQAK